MKYQPLLHIVLYEPEIPPNTGAVGRTCVAIGAKLWLVRPLGFQIDAKTRRRAGLDYWAHLEWEVCDHWAHLQERLANHRFWYFTKTATRSYLSAEYQTGDVLVFGSESTGIPSSVLTANAERNLRIPLRPEVRSLNLSCAASVAGYEALRQIAPQ
ncbi:MAG: tRNA (cytidine(34)-2'-O)-methyltransferase [bacterium]|nr:tRNA (cytidine(34)-2'-O)-methyltransferase [bacterium]